MTTASFRLFLFILVFAPLAFGTVEHWSLMTVEILTIVSFLVCLVGLRLAGASFYQVPGLLPLVLLLGVAAVQLVPMPPGLLEVISPMSWEAYRPVYELDGGDGWLPISVNQRATLQELLRFGSYALFYILTIQLLRDGGRIRKTLHLVALLASAIAFVAILQQFSSGGRIYWLRLAPGGSPGGPWVNINQYGAFIEAVCPLVLALFLFYRPPAGEDTSRRERFVSLFSSPKSNLHLFLGFSFVLLVFSVFVTLCRGGIITILASMILFALLAGYKRGSYSRATFWVVVCLALLAVTWFGWQPIIDEFDKAFTPSGAISDARLQLWSDTLEMSREYLLIGGGVGTFSDIYPSYKTIANVATFDHAHNDYLELLAGGGMIGFGLGAWFVLAVLAHGWKKVLIRRDRLAVLVGIGALTSICALLMHSVVDFNLQNGAVGLYFFFLCGLLVAVVNSRYSHYRYRSLLPEMGRAASSFLLVGGGAYLVVATLTQTGVLIAGNKYAGVSTIYLNRHLDEALIERVDGRLKDAMVFDPLNGRYDFNRGTIALIRQNPYAAQSYFLKAARRQPMEGAYLQRLGMTLGLERQGEAAWLLREGYRRALNKEQLALNWAEWLLLLNKRDQALEVLKEQLHKHPAQLKTIFALLEPYQISRAEIQALLPQTVAAWIGYGEYLEATGTIEEAGYYRSGALDFLDQEDDIKPAWFVQLINYYRRHKQPDQAIEVVRRGLAKAPDYAPFHIWLGDYYQKEGIFYRAREEYERAVMLEPANASYRNKLKKLELDIEFGQ